MIFYLLPPGVCIFFEDFNECCFSRFRFLSANADSRDYETFAKQVIPGEETDRIGHFLLKCFAAHHPAAKDFILEQELNLFRHRLETLPKEYWRKSCTELKKQIPRVEKSTVFNPLKDCREPPPVSEFILPMLFDVCDTFLDQKTVSHLRTACVEDCSKYSLMTPFQMCPSFIRKRSVPLDDGYSLVPCSMWNSLLVELFRYHYEYGLTLITDKVLPDIQLDERFSNLFSQLIKRYDRFEENKSLVSSSRLSARDVYFEKIYFPPCMADLMKTLRTDHRLSHFERYRLTLFLKDIGLSVDESIAFWKTEYSKSCKAGSSCTHTWQAMEKKYTYNIRHAYGLEGSRQPQQSQNCQYYQDISVGFTDRGGCPFVHYDKENLQTSLLSKVTRDADKMGEILRLKDANNPCAACNVYRAAYAKIVLLYEPSDEFSSPLEYYTSLEKSYLDDGSLDW